MRNISAKRTKKRPDEALYCIKAPDVERYFDILMEMCAKFKVDWKNADIKDRAFVLKVGRIKSEREMVAKYW